MERRQVSVCFVFKDVVIPTLLLKLLIYCAITDPFQAAPSFTMQVNNDSIRVQSSSDKSSLPVPELAAQEVGSKRKAIGSNVSTDCVESGSLFKRKRTTEF